MRGLGLGEEIMGDGSEERRRWIRGEEESRWEKSVGRKGLEDGWEGKDYWKRGKRRREGRERKSV
jgi:hypothetical protein